MTEDAEMCRRGAQFLEQREGRFVYYRVAPNGLRPLVDWLAHYRTFWPGRLKRLEALLEEMDE